MTTKQPDPMINHKGNEVPKNMVRKDHLRRDKTVRKIFVIAEKLEQKIISDKHKMLKEIEKFKKWLEKNYEAEADFQNLTLSDYSNQMKVEIKSAAVIEFDEKIQIAENIIKQLVGKWALESGNANLTVLVESAFKTDKKGFLDKNRILGLKAYKINHPEWKKAMQLIDDAVQIVDRKSYMQIKYKNDNGKWKNLQLNFSNAEVE